MLTILILIYISFISLGLPDSILGSAWPVMYKDLSVPISYAGIISMIVGVGTVVSSLISARVIKRFGTALVTAVSVGMTAAALLGFAFTKSFVFLCLMAVPLGLGAGSVDAALNNFVALHFKSMHMNWLHSFWGVGTTIGPIIMSYWLAQNNNWQMGYITIGLLQVILVIILFLSLPFWKKVSISQNKARENRTVTPSLRKIIKIPNVKKVLIAFFSYCALEWTTGLWAGSYAVQHYGVLSETAAQWTSLYFLGITLGRIGSGFVSMKLSTKQLIRIGLGSIFSGIFFMLLPFGIWKVPAGLVVIGLGCAPIFPEMIHRTPEIFSNELSQAVIGIQMASAYVGTAFMPPLFGLIADYISISLFPLYLLIWVIFITISTELINIKTNKKA